VLPKLSYKYKEAIYNDLTYDFSDPTISTGKGFNYCSSNCVIISERNGNARKMVGEMITISNVSYTVIGTTNEQKVQIFLPSYVQKDVINTNEQKETGVYIISPQKAKVAKSDVEAIIAILNSGDVGYVFSNMSEEITLSIMSATNSLAVFGALIGSISLFIAAINMFNIMYIATLERKKEVALLRSFGVKKSVIKLCFLIESMTLVAFFGIIGSLLGFIIAWIVLGFMHIPLFVNTISVVLGLIVILLIGILSGYSPARKAAGINPTILLK